jgi:type VI secretion system secreted protein Hcp
MSRLLFALPAALAILAGGTPAFAQEIQCTVTGAKQGMFQGDRGSRSTQIPVLFLTEAITTSYDAGTGLASGKRTHEPLTIVKELDASSIQFFQAAVTNELLKSVTCTFYRAYRSGAAAGAGAGRPYFRITLTNALIVEYKDSGDGINGDALGDERERISLTYQRIELTDLDSNGTAGDDWLAD